MRALLALTLAAFGCDGPPRPAAESAPRLEPSEGPIARIGGDSSALEYTLSLASANKHIVDVALSFVPERPGAVELWLPTWTPGSYLIREYARQIEGLSASSAAGPLDVAKVAKNRWRIEGAGADALTIRYRVYARELSVRTNFVDDELASLVGAATFVTVAGSESAPHDVTIAMRPGWMRAVSGLDPHPSGDPHRFLATNYDELVDSPIVTGSPVVTDFQEGGAAHVLASFGATSTWDASMAKADVARLVAEHQAFWRVVPYRRFVILNLLLGGGGGLEHLDSTLLLGDRNLMANPDRYRSWLGLVSHELFHIWNGKRLRPKPLGPFDYENEVYTEDLWIVEGLTQYYDDLLLARSGLATESQYLEALGGQFQSLEATPGRTVQPLAAASYDAWIKYYRGDENSANSSVSYYTKGAVVGFLLDMTIRRASGGRASLDDVMRRAYDRFSGQVGYTSSEFRALASEVADVDLSEFFRRAIDSTDSLDYNAALDFVGLRFKATKLLDKGDGGAAIGVRASGSGVISRVERDGAAWKAGLNVDDELIAIEGERIGTLTEALKLHKPGDEVEILFTRRGRMRTLRLVLDGPSGQDYALEKLPTRSTAQAAAFSSWLKADGR